MSEVTVRFGALRGAQRESRHGEAAVKFAVDRDVLSQAVTWVARILPNRPPLPVLAGIVLRVDGGRLTLTTFDYEVSAETSIDVRDAEPGTALVHGRLLTDIVRTLPPQVARIAVAGSELEISCGTAEFALPMMPVDEYPIVPPHPPTVARVDAATFAEAALQVAMSASRDDAVPLLTGIRMEATGGQVAFLATDRYRLAVRDFAWEPLDPDLSLQAVIPAKPLLDLAKTFGDADGEVVLAFAPDANGGLAGFGVDSRRATIRVFEPAAYPPVRRLFAAHYGIHATVEVAAAIEAVRRVALVGDRSTPVVLTFSRDGLNVTARGDRDARAAQTLDVMHEGEVLSTSLNPHFLLDGLTACGSPRAVFSFVDASKPPVLAPADQHGRVIPGFRYLVQPVRLASTSAARA